MSDVDTNQHVAVASGSDTDSIMSLTKRSGDVTLRGSSSPIQSTEDSQSDILVESAFSGSDANDDTILKVHVVGEDDEEKAIVFFDKDGNVRLSEPAFVVVFYLFSSPPLIIILFNVANLLRYIDCR